MLTVKQIAEQAAVSEETVLAWINGGELRASNCSRRRGLKPRWRVRADDLDAFLDARMNRPAATTSRRRNAVGDGIIQFYS